MLAAIVSAMFLAFQAGDNLSFNDTTPDEDLRELADAGHGEAQAELAIRLHARWADDPSDTGQDVNDPRLIESRNWAERAAETGTPEALNLLGMFALHGLTQDADSERAEDYFVSAMAAGDSAAPLNLASLYLWSVEQNRDAEAVAILENYLEESHESPMMRIASGYLGQALTYGNGTVVQDHDRAFALLQTADETEEGDRQTLYLLGRYEESGAGGATGGVSAALDYFERAGALGHGYSAWKAGMQHLNGDGTQANATVAFNWIYLSAQNGNYQGMISTAVMLAIGQGVAPDQPQARHWYEQAASLGSAHAIRGLGGMLVSGEGGPVDPVLGVAMLELAREGGDPLADQLLQQINAPSDAESRVAIETAKENWLRDADLSVADLFYEG